MPNNNNVKFGNLVKKWRAAKKKTQEELAFESKISVTYISKIENGQTNVSLDTICKIAKGLGISVSELVKGM